MNDQQPIVVSPTAAGALALTFIRQLALIIGGAVSVAAMARGRDLQGLLDYVQGDTFAATVGFISTAGVVIYGQFRELRKKAEAVTMANALPDAIAIVAKKRGPLGRLVDRIRAL